MFRSPPKTAFRSSLPASFKDPAFWIVLISFALFLAVAAAVFRSSPQFRTLAVRASGSSSRPSAPAAAKTVLMDSRSFSKWIHFSLSSGSVVHPRYVSSQNWDLAFRRYHVIANGGVTNLAAAGAIADLGRVGFNRLDSVSKTRFVSNTRAANGQDPENRAIGHWYVYDYATHVLTPMPHVYLVRTPRDRYFALRILNYYCKSGRSGCLTFEYRPVSFKERN